MKQPKLTFFCELDADALQALFSDADVIEDLRALGAGVSMGLRDLSPERAAVVRILNEAGIPLVAWLLLPEEQGYWFNVDNALPAMLFYVDFRAWTLAHNLRWEGVGLDIEPDMREIRKMAGGDAGAMAGIVRRAFDTERLRRAQTLYTDLVMQIRRDGYRVDSYEIPFVVDERRGGSTLLQRLFGLIRLDMDREVLMLYSSFLRPVGHGLLWSYAPSAGSVGVGSTGGGVTVAGVDQIPPLTWDEFARDLRLAHAWSDDIHVFSLEGAVCQGFLHRLRDFDWLGRVEVPLREFRQVERARKVLRAVLWTSAHPGAALAGVVGVLWLLSRFLPRRRQDTKKY